MQYELFVIWEMPEEWLTLYKEELIELSFGLTGLKFGYTNYYLLYCDKIISLWDLFYSYVKCG